MTSTDDLIAHTLYDQITACKACDIRREARRPLPPEGPRLSTALFIGQSPGNDDERAGRIFTGAAGEEFDRWLRVLRVDRKRVALANIVHCHTDKNRAPRVGETRVCAERWLPPLFEAMPNVQVIFALGRAAHSLLLPKMAVPALDMAAVRVAFGPLKREFMVYPLVLPSYIVRIPAERRRQMEVLANVRDHWAREYPEAYRAVVL